MRYFIRQIFLFYLAFGFLLSQVRVGEMKSITSSLNVRSVIGSGDEIILATQGGLGVYHLNSGNYKVFTKDQGLVNTDLKTAHKGPKGFIWIGSDTGVQVWNLDEEKQLDWFQLDIEAVSGFVSYKDMVYGAVKQNGVWGIMEFIHSKGRTYYRDFYGRDDIGYIEDIIKFGDNLILLTDLGLIGGNPHQMHPIYWEKRYTEIEQPIIAMAEKNEELALVTFQAIYSIQLNKNPVPLVTNQSEFSTIRSIAVRGLLDYMAVTDSAIYRIGTDMFEKQFSDPGFHFSDIKINNSSTIIGTNLGFVQFDGSTLNHVAGNEPIVSAPQVISMTSDNQLIMASASGISLSGWINFSTSTKSDGFSTQLNLEKSPIDLGNSVSRIILGKDGNVYMGLIHSTSAGIVALDVSNGINVHQLYFPKTQSTEDEVYIVSGIALDGKENIWSTSGNNYNQPLSVFNGSLSRHFSINESGGILSKNSHVIASDNFNRIWIGSPSGLVMYKYSGDVMDPTSEIWIEESVDPGMTIRVPLDINVSAKNRLWILTPIGLIHKDLQVSDTNPVSQTGPTGTNGELFPYFPNVVFNSHSRIRFDPRGNVWVTSEFDGIHVVTENGEYWPDINGLNESNSNLLSNHVNDVTFDKDEGIAYIATDKGVSVIRIPFSEEKKSYNSVNIFPSPFRIPSSIPMTVEGLKDESSLKIMTLNGEVMRSIPNSEVQGYQAYWDGRDTSGQLVGTGVYLIAVYDKSGAATIGKVAVIRE
jgi:ligand-binding sensor domain-containing protein